MLENTGQQFECEIALKHKVNNNCEQQHLSVKLKGFELWTHYVPATFFMIPSIVTVFCFVTGKLQPDRTHDMLIISAVCICISALMMWGQRRALRFVAVETSNIESTNYHLVLKTIRAAHWKIRQEHESSMIVAAVSGFPKSMRSWGERVEIHFSGNHVYVNSICDPSKWSSATAWGRNEENVKLIRKAVTNS
jgi:hypothetical protein